MENAPRSVLIVDSSADTREVLRTALARRGLKVFEAQAADEGLELARQYRPDVIVLDLEDEPQRMGSIRDEYTAQTGAPESELVILGRVRRQPTFTGGHVISKPYHFAPLVHTIEQLAAKAA